MNIHTTNNYYGNAGQSHNFFAQTSEQVSERGMGRKATPKQILVRVDSHGDEIKVFDFEIEPRENS